MFFIFVLLNRHLYILGTFFRDLILIIFQLYYFFPLLCRLLLKFDKLLVIHFLEHGLLLALELLMHFQILNECYVSLENTSEHTLFLLTPGENSGTRIPSKRIL